MKEVKVETISVRSEVNRTMIDDLSTMMSFDIVSELESRLVADAIRPYNRIRSIDKIFNSQKTS